MYLLGQRIENIHEIYTRIIFPRLLVESKLINIVVKYVVLRLDVLLEIGLVLPLKCLVAELAVDLL